MDEFQGLLPFDHIVQETKAAKENPEGSEVRCFDVPPACDGLLPFIEMLRRGVQEVVSWEVRGNQIIVVVMPEKKGAQPAQPPAHARDGALKH